MKNTNNYFQKLKSFCEINEQFRIAFEVNIFKKLTLLLFSYLFMFNIDIILVARENRKIGKRSKM